MNYQAFTNDSLTMMYEGIRTRGRLLIVSPVWRRSSPLSGRNSTYPTVQFPRASSEIKSAMAGNFKFDVQREVTSNRTLGVKFEVKERHPVTIKLIGGSIQVRIHTGGGMIYSEIKMPSDLSKEKLGALVQTIIEG